jgi:hypothetical protein
LLGLLALPLKLLELAENVLVAERLAHVVVALLDLSRCQLLVCEHVVLNVLQRKRHDDWL